MPVDMNRCCSGLVFELVQMNVVERRLEEAPQEREHT